MLLRMSRRAARGVGGCGVRVAFIVLGGSVQSSTRRHDGGAVKAHSESVRSVSRSAQPPVTTQTTSVSAVVRHKAPSWARARFSRGKCGSLFNVVHKHVQPGGGRHPGQAISRHARLTLAAPRVHLSAFDTATHRRGGVRASSFEAECGERRCGRAITDCLTDRASPCWRCALGLT